MSNLEILKKGYQDFETGNIEGVLSSWHKDIVWEECAGFPYVSDDGKYVGSQTVLNEVLAPIPEHYDNFKIQISDFVDGGDKIVMVGHYTGTWKATGKKFKANATHTWTFEDGKAIHFFQAVDSATIINP
nr:nuclear transport factor 2 family protein [Sunxiuqinia sp.]